MNSEMLVYSLRPHLSVAFVLTLLNLSLLLFFSARSRISRVSIILILLFPSICLFFFQFDPLCLFILVLVK